MKKLVFASLFLALGTFAVNAQSTPSKKKAEPSKKSAKQSPKKSAQPNEAEHAVPVAHESGSHPSVDKEQPKQKESEDKKEEHPVNPQK
jgi:hypothetical protein